MAARGAHAVVRTPTSVGAALTGHRAESAAKRRFGNAVRNRGVSYARKMARTKMGAARSGDLAARLLNKIVKQRPITPEQEALKEYAWARKVLQYITNNFPDFHVDTEVTYSEYDADRNEQCRGRMDIQLTKEVAGARIMHIVDMKTTPMLHSEHLREYKKHTAVSVAGVPNSKYVEHQAQVIEEMRVMRRKHRLLGQADTRITGEIIVVTGDMQLVSYPADPTLDQEHIFTGVTVDAIDILKKALPFKVHNIPAACIPTGIARRFSVQPLAENPQMVYGKSDGSVCALWVFSAAMGVEAMRAVEAAASQYAFAQGRALFVDDGARIVQPESIIVED
jgi:hypothetical protein